LILHYRKRERKKEREREELDQYVFLNKISASSIMTCVARISECDTVTMVRKINKHIFVAFFKSELKYI